MNFQTLFGVFSRRETQQPSAELTDSFRNRIMMRCRDVFSYFGNLEDFWIQIHSQLSFLHGRPSLSNNLNSNAVNDVLTFLGTCSDTHFLDFIEIIFQVEQTQRLPDSKTLIDEFNQFLLIDNLPFAITDFVWESGTEIAWGQERQFMRLTDYPKVIRKDSLVTHNYAIKPVLALLTEKHFYAANHEFIESLEDFRKGDFGDCLTKCASAFESTLKIICERKKWKYSATDTVAPLLKTVIKNSSMDNFFEQPILLIATMRNRLSTAHGSGVTPRAVSSAQAEFAINATAAAILLLVKECAA